MSSFRILARYDAETDTLYPFSVYTHDQYANQPTNHDIVGWLKNLAATELRVLPLLDEDEDLEADTAGAGQGP